MKKIILAAVAAFAMLAMSGMAEARRYSQNTQYSQTNPYDSNPLAAIFGDDQVNGWTYDTANGWQVNPMPRFKNAKQARSFERNFHRPVHTVFNTDAVHNEVERALGAPSASLVAYGHMLQQQGFRVSEHPAFGGVHHVHAHHSAHYSGNAIDINVGAGVYEAHSAYAHRFDQIAAAARAAGYKVLWRVAGHYDHIHIQR